MMRSGRLPKQPTLPSLPRGPTEREVVDPLPSHCRPNAGPSLHRRVAWGTPEGTLVGAARRPRPGRAQATDQRRVVPRLRALVRRCGASSAKTQGSRTRSSCRFGLEETQGNSCQGASPGAALTPRAPTTGLRLPAVGKSCRCLVSEMWQLFTATLRTVRVPGVCGSAARTHRLSGLGSARQTTSPPMSSLPAIPHW
ncbi:MAG: hypothetical protein ACI80V_002880 [Rhodothermales bacterium]|jgi:hypothetical protein